MTDKTKETTSRFLGTYFDRDVVGRVAYWAGVSSWVVLVFHLFAWLISFSQFLIQFSGGLFYNKGMTVFDTVSVFAPYLLQPLPGLLYFFSLQAISHLLLMFLDIEENTRRAGRSTADLR